MSEGKKVEALAYLEALTVSIDPKTEAQINMCAKLKDTITSMDFSVSSSSAFTAELEEVTDEIRLKCNRAPSKEQRDQLKAATWKWHGQNKYWYCKKASPAYDVAKALGETLSTATATSG